MEISIDLKTNQIMKSLIVIILLILFQSCRQTESKKEFRKEITIFLKNDLRSFKGYEFHQSAFCIINIITPDGLYGAFSGIPSKEEIKNKFGNESIYNILVFCKKNNIYSFETFEGDFVIKTNNEYYSFTELKQRDETYYDNSLGESSFLKDPGNLKQSLCYFIGNDKSILDSLSNQRKIYKYCKGVYYFWDVTPPLFLKCDNGLIR